MKKHTAEQYARALYEVTSTLSEKETQKAVVAFVELVRRDGLGKQLTRIADAYERYEMKREGRLPLLVKTKHPLDAKLKRALRERFGEKREIAETVVPHELGGMLVRDGDTLYDATLDTQLVKFHEHLTA